MGVGWSLTSLFSTNTAISETKGQGWRVILTQWRKASDILTSTLAAFLFSSHPKRERDWEAHLNYYASVDNRSRQLLHHKTKLNQIQQNIHLNWYKINTTNQTQVWALPMTSGLETEWDYSVIQGRDGQNKKIGKANHHNHTTTVLRPFFRDHQGELVPEENFWTLWCKRRLTEADTTTIRLGATPSRLTTAHLHHPPMFFTGRMPFLPPNQQCQSTEGN